MIYVSFMQIYVYINNIKIIKNRFKYESKFN